MNELKQKLMSIGLSEEMTEKAIATVAEYVKEKLPSSYHGMVDDAMSGKMPDVGSLLGNLGGFFGR